MVTGTTGLRLPRRQHRARLVAGRPHRRALCPPRRGCAGRCQGEALIVTGLVTAAGVQGEAELCSGPGSPATARPVSAAGRRQIRGVDPRLDQHCLPAVIDDVHDPAAPRRPRPVRWPVGPLHHHASEAPRAVRQPADPAVPGDDGPVPIGLRTRRHRSSGSWCRPGWRDLVALGQPRSRPSTHPTRHTRKHDTASRTCATTRGDNPLRLPDAVRISPPPNSRPTRWPGSFRKDAARRAGGICRGRPAARGQRHLRRWRPRAGCSPGGSRTWARCSRPVTAAG